MEIKINIEKNDYVQPTEVREEVVQGICDAFLKGGCDSTFHPFRDGRYRSPTVYIWKWKNDKKFIGFDNTTYSTDSYAKKNKDCIRLNGKEMKTAFKALINAGYHIFKVYKYGTWMGYIVDKKPFREDGEEVFSFNDFID